jgi:hypothetical protein
LPDFDVFVSIGTEPIPTVVCVVKADLAAVIGVELFNVRRDTAGQQEPTPRRRYTRHNLLCVSAA